MSPAPSFSVLKRFGLAGQASKLSGFDARTYRVGDVILKGEDNVEEADFVADLVSTLPERGFRLPRPLRTDSNEWQYEGWTAWTVVPGKHEKGRWREIVDVGDLFHAVLAEEPRPSFLDSLTHQWAVGDRIAFGEQVAEIPEPFDSMVSRLLQRLRPLEDAREQLIHGDLTGNVLFADGMPPAIIDFSFYFRPIGFATAVVVIDALAYEGGPPDLTDLLPPADRFQLLARALIFRLVAAALYRPDQQAAVLNSVAERHSELLRWLLDQL